MSSTKTFSKDYLMDELHLPYNNILDKIIDHTRWSVIHEIVFKNNDNKTYRTTYSEGATESQFEAPWEYEDDIECTEVELKEVVRLEWVNKDENS